MTDSGVCQVFNGDVMSATFNVEEGSRVQELRNVFDNREAGKRLKIEGTGYTHEKTFWFDLEDK